MTSNKLDLTLKGIAAAMATAVIVLGVLKNSQVNILIAMLAIGLFGLALSSLSGGRHEI
jgi:hypothetical protein